MQRPNPVFVSIATLILFVSALPSRSVTLPPRSHTTLGIDGTRFTVNEKPQFLIGISYYGGLGASKEIVTADLGQMRRYRFNWIRVWATWRAFGKDVSAMDEDGRGREPYLTNLRHIVEECDRSGTIVDVTLSRGNGAKDSPRLETLEAHTRAVETLTRALKSFANWYIDLSNERNVRDARYSSIEDLRSLRDTVRRIDPNRLVTASDGGDVDADGLRAYVEDAKLDFVCPHRPRAPSSPAQTESKVRGWLADMRTFARIVPIHLQEPFRRGYGTWQPKAEDYAADLRGAISGGAAGWCLHNGAQSGTPDSMPRRSFDLSERGLFDQLDSEELRALPLLSAEVNPIHKRASGAEVRCSSAVWTGRRSRPNVFLHVRCDASATHRFDAEDCFDLPTLWMQPKR